MQACAKKTGTGTLTAAMLLPDRNLGNYSTVPKKGNEQVNHG